MEPRATSPTTTRPEVEVILERSPAASSFTAEAVDRFSLLALEDFSLEAPSCAPYNVVFV